MTDFYVSDESNVSNVSNVRGGVWRGRGGRQWHFPAQHCRLAWGKGERGGGGVDGECGRSNAQHSIIASLKSWDGACVLRPNHGRLNGTPGGGVSGKAKEEFVICNPCELAYDTNVLLHTT